MKLQAYTPEDGFLDRLVVSWRNDSIKYFFSDEHITVASHRRWFRNQQWGSTQFYFVAKVGEMPVGVVSLYNVDRTHLRSEYGRLLVNPEHRGEGLGYDILSALLMFAFQDLGLNRVYGDILLRNTVAISLVKRLGFVQEGVFREHVYKEGYFLDVVRMGILREDWLRGDRT